jgi:sec-independent protein translocase protein TatA
VGTPRESANPSRLVLTERNSVLFAFIKNLGGPELLIILVVVLLLFGASKLPGLARSIGASTKEFKKGVEEGVEDAAPKSDSEEV